MKIKDLIKKNNNEKEMPLIIDPQSSMRLRDSVFSAGFGALHAIEKDGNKSLCLTSLKYSQNKANLAINMAIIASQKQYKSIIIDFDCDNNYVAKKLNSGIENSLTDVVTGKIPFESAVKNFDGIFDYVVTGNKIENGNKMSFQIVKDLIAYCEKTYDCIILNAKTANSAETELLVENTDGLVLVVNEKKDSIKDVLACQNLYGEKFLGVIKI